jgi:hypothetical protein
LNVVGNACVYDGAVEAGDHQAPPECRDAANDSPAR